MLPSLERETMTKPTTLGQIGQISRSVRNVEQSTDWYSNKVGLAHLYTFGKLSFFDCAGTRLFLEENENPSSESIIYLQVPDINAAYDELRSRGVAFSTAPHLIHRHGDGTEEWMAFFDDLEGRPLALMSRTRS